MPKDFTAPSQNWNVQDQLDQSKVINAKREQENASYNALKQEEQVKWDRLKKYESEGYDMSSHYDKFKTIGADAGVGARAYQDFRKFTSEGSKTLLGLAGANDAQYDNNIREVKLREDNWKQKQSDLNPQKYPTKDDVWNVAGGFGAAAPYMAGGYAAGFSKAPTLGARILGDVARGGAADLAVGGLQHGYKDNWDSELAKEVGIGVAGQVAGTSLAHLLSKVGASNAMPSLHVKKPEETNIKPEQSDTVSAQQPISQTQDNIAAKINEANFGTQQQQVPTRSDMPIVNQSKAPIDEPILNIEAPIQKIPEQLPFNNQSEMMEIMKVAKENNAIDEFMSKLPNGANIEKIRNTFNQIQPAQAINKTDSFADDAQRIYDMDAINEFEGITKAVGDNTASTLELSRPTTTMGIRNAMSRFESGKATERDFEILDSIERFMKYEGTNFREKATTPRYKPNTTIDDAVSNNMDYNTANRMGAIPFSNGSETVGGGAVGGMESEFNQRDYNNDGTHNYKDNLIGTLIGAVGINAARKLMPKAFKDKNIDDNTAGMFVGAKPTDKGAFSDVATKKTMREIDDTPSLTKTGTWGTSEDMKAGNTTTAKLHEVFTHDELFSKYPDLKDVNVSLVPDKKGASWDAENNRVTVGYDKKNGIDKSNLLHEIQHNIQDKEGWAKGGSTTSPEVIDQAVKELYSKYKHLPYIKQAIEDMRGRKLSHAEYKHKIISIANTTEDMGAKGYLHDVYRKLWGEQQSRATEARMNYTPEQRASEDWTKTLEKTEGKYNEPIIKYDGGVARSEDVNTSNFLKNQSAKVEAKIKSGEIPEKGRTVISPYENGKSYYLGESGEVYFQTGNGKWRATPNVDTIKDVKYVAENGLTSFKKMNSAEDLRFEKALEASKKLETEKANTYKMSHKAPNKDTGASANDVTEMFSKDIYSKDAARIHKHGSKSMDMESIKVIQSAKNKPDAEVTIYRAIPKDINAKINADDWVTTSKQYAKEHGDGPLKGNYKILEMKVKAKDLYTDGNSIHEWGYSPSRTMDGVKGMTAMSSPTLSGGIVGGIVGGTNDLDGDEKITMKDILIGAGIGAGGTKGVMYLMKSPKAKEAFKNFKENQNVNAIYGFNIKSAKDYTKLREEVFIKVNKDMEANLFLHEQLKFLSDAERKDMYHYMVGEQVNSLNPNVKALADNYTKVIDGYSDQLVDLGILTKGEADKFQGRYLHRSYQKDFKEKFSSLFAKGKSIKGVHARGNEWIGTKAEYDKRLADGEIGDFFDSKIEAYRMNNGQYKFKQDWTKEQRTRWGEIEDTAFSLPETLMRNAEMVHHATFLKKVLNETGYVLDEAAQGYTQMNGKRFGALQGKYVRNDIQQDINEFNEALFGQEGVGFSTDFVNTLKSFLTYWKKTHTVYNPVAHVNNLLSNISLQYTAGINPNKAVINAGRGYVASGKVGMQRQLLAKERIMGLSPQEKIDLKAYTQDEDLKLWNKAKDAGLFGRSKLNDVLNKYVKPTTVSKSSKSMNLLSKANEKASIAYQNEDDIMRFSVLKSLLEGNKMSSFEDAVREVSKTIPDYTQPMSYWARKMRNTGIMPFVSWTYHATPILINQSKEHPLRVASVFGALYGINKLMGIDPFDERDIPQQNFSMKRIPIYKDGSEVTTIKVDRWIPHNDIFNPHDFLKNMLSMGVYTPLFEIPRNQNTYFGGKISYRKGGDKAYDIGKYAASQVTPDIADSVGGLIESNLLTKKKRKKNPVIEPRSTTQEIFRILGLNTMTYNKSNQARKAIQEKKK